jgi:hypothetical protein
VRARGLDLIAETEELDRARELRLAVELLADEDRASWSMPMPRE